MSKLRFLKGAVVSAACLGLIFPAPIVHAGVQTTRTSQQIHDIKLQQGGLLIGKVVDAQGTPVDGATVSVSHNGRVVARAVTQRGTYQIQGLRGGTHVVSAGQGRTVARFWTESAAPRSAAGQAVTVARGKVVRGQGVVYMDGAANGAYCPPPAAAIPPAAGVGCMDIVTIATVGLATAALVIAIDNNNTLDDIEDRLDMLASP